MDRSSDSVGIFGRFVLFQIRVNDCGDFDKVNEGGADGVEAKEGCSKEVREKGANKVEAKRICKGTNGFALAERRDGTKDASRDGREQQL